MYETSKPDRGRSQRVSCTGFANAVQAVGGKGKQVLVKANGGAAGVTGGAVAANTDVVLMYIGEEGVGTTAFTGYPLSPGEAITLSMEEVAMLRFRGASGDFVNIIIMA